MLARLVAPKIPRQPSVPPALPLYKNPVLLSRPESTLLQVLIPLHFNSSTINTYKKPQGGAPARNSKVLQLVTYTSQPIQLNRTCHAPLATHHSSLATIPFRITFFAHPHHLTLIESHSCKKQGRGWGRMLTQVPTQTIRLLSTTSQHRPRSNGRNSNPLHPLLHDYWIPPGVGSAPPPRHPSLATSQWHRLQSVFLQGGSLDAVV